MHFLSGSLLSPPDKINEIYNKNSAEKNVFLAYKINGVINVLEEECEAES